MPPAAALEFTTMSNGFRQSWWARAAATVLLVASLLSSAAIAGDRVHSHDAVELPGVALAADAIPDASSPDDGHGTCERCAHVAAEFAQHALPASAPWPAGIQPATTLAAVCPVSMQAPPLRPPRGAT